MIGRLQRLKEVVLFIPVIYKCYRWDSSSLYQILEHWLGRMEDCHNGDTIHSNAPRYARQLRVAKLLAKRIYEDRYLVNNLKPHQEKWGESSFEFRPLGNQGHQMIISNPKVTNESERQQERKEFLEIIRKSACQRQKDVEVLFRIMRKYSLYWWT